MSEKRALPSGIIQPKSSKVQLRLSSIKESSPVALLEAMATGVPVLATAIPGVRDFLVNFPDLMFPVRSPRELESKLCSMIQKDDTARQALGLALRREVEARFSIEREVRDHEEFYLSL